MTQSSNQRHCYLTQLHECKDTRRKIARIDLLYSNQIRITHHSDQKILSEINVLLATLKYFKISVAIIDVDLV